jgi:hypothetical protein
MDSVSVKDSFAKLTSYQPRIIRSEYKNLVTRT